MKQEMYIPKFYGVRADSYVNRIYRDDLLMNHYIKSVIDAIYDGDNKKLSDLINHLKLEQVDIEVAKKCTHIARYKGNFIVCIVGDELLPNCAYQLTYREPDGKYFKMFMSDLDKESSKTKRELFIGFLYGFMKYKVMLAWQEEEDEETVRGRLFRSFPDFNDQIDEICFYRDESCFSTVCKDTYLEMMKCFEIGMTIKDIMAVYPKDSDAYMLSRPLGGRETKKIENARNEFIEKQEKKKRK